MLGQCMLRLIILLKLGFVLAPLTEPSWPNKLVTVWNKSVSSLQRCPWGICMGQLWAVKRFPESLVVFYGIAALCKLGFRKVMPLFFSVLLSLHPSRWLALRENKEWSGRQRVVCLFFVFTKDWRCVHITSFRCSCAILFSLFGAGLWEHTSKCSIP